MYFRSLGFDVNKVNFTAVANFLSYNSSYNDNKNDNDNNSCSSSSSIYINNSNYGSSTVDQIDCSDPSVSSALEVFRFDDATWAVYVTEEGYTYYLDTATQVERERERERLCM